MSPPLYWCSDCIFSDTVDSLQSTLHWGQYGRQVHTYRATEAESVYIYKLLALLLLLHSDFYLTCARRASTIARAI